MVHLNSVSALGPLLVLGARRGAAPNMIVKQLLNVSVECAPVVFGKPFKLRLQRGFDS